MIVLKSHKTQRFCMKWSFPYLDPILGLFRIFIIGIVEWVLLVLLTVHPIMYSLKLQIFSSLAQLVLFAVHSIVYSPILQIFSSLTQLGEYGWYCLQFIPSCTAQYYRYFHHWHNWASTVGTVCIPSRHVHCTLPKHHSYFKQVLYFILEQPESSLLYFLWNSKKVFHLEQQ